MSGAKCRAAPEQTVTCRLQPFRYLAPTTVEEAVAALEEEGGRATLFAGGTDLVPMMKLGVASPKTIISLSAIPGLQYIREEADGVHLGPLTTIAQLRRSALLRERWPALFEAVRHFAAPQVRNMATLGGNIGRRSPCANTPPPLIALSAVLTLVSSNGPRAISLEQYFDRHDTAAGELILDIAIPYPPAQSGSAFMELTRNSGDLAKVNCAASITSSGGVCSDARIVLGSVANWPIRALQVEQALIGKGLDDAAIKDAAGRVVDEIAPITDARSSAEYRRQVSPVLVSRTVRRAAKRAGA
jgi:carbon-monoxide dehydrogenase medium subunit